MGAFARLSNPTLRKMASDGEVVGLTAKSYEVSEDGKTWKFFLKDDLNWSDGQKLSAGDVEFAYNYLAENHPAAGRTKKTAESTAMKEAPGLDPSCKVRGNRLDLCLMKSSRYDGAIKAYDQAIELDGKYRDAWNNKGIALILDEKDYGQAIRCFDNAIAIDAKCVEAWVNKANAYTGMGRDSDADYAFAKAAKLGYAR